MSCDLGSIFPPGNERVNEKKAVNYWTRRFDDAIIIMKNKPGCYNNYNNDNNKKV